MLNLVKRFNPVHTDTNVLQFHEQPESQFQTQLITSISFSLIQLVSENRSRPSFKSKIKAQAHSPFTSLSIPSITCAITFIGFGSIQKGRDKSDNRTDIH